MTRFCPRLRIGQSKDGPDPAGHYAFGPGEESQHDTSPVSILVGPRTRFSIALASAGECAAALDLIGLETDAEDVEVREAREDPEAVGALTIGLMRRT